MKEGESVNLEFSDILSRIKIRGSGTCYKQKKKMKHNLKVRSTCEHIASEEERHSDSTQQLRDISCLRFLSAVSATVVISASVSISSSGEEAPAPDGIKQRVEAGAAPGQLEAQLLAEQVVGVQVRFFPVHVLRHEVRQQAGEREHGLAAVLNSTNIH